MKMLAPQVDLPPQFPSFAHPMPIKSSPIKPDLEKELGFERQKKEEAMKDDSFGSPLKPPV